MTTIASRPRGWCPCATRPRSVGLAETLHPEPHAQATRVRRSMTSMRAARRAPLRSQSDRSRSCRSPHLRTISEHVARRRTTPRRPESDRAQARRRLKGTPSELSLPGAEPDGHGPAPIESASRPRLGAGALVKISWCRDHASDPGLLERSSESEPRRAGLVGHPRRAESSGTERRHLARRSREPLVAQLTGSSVDRCGDHLRRGTSSPAHETCAMVGTSINAGGPTPESSALTRANLCAGADRLMGHGV